MKLSKTFNFLLCFYYDPDYAEWHIYLFVYFYITWLVNNQFLFPELDQSAQLVEK